MAVNIFNNSKGKKVTVHVTNANGTIVIAGNNSVSNVAIGDEFVIGAIVNQLWYGCANGGYWILKRANSTTNTVVGVYDSTGYCDYAGVGSPIPIRQNDDLVLELTNSASGYIMVELRKIGNNNFNKT